MDIQSPADQVGEFGLSGGQQRKRNDGDKDFITNKNNESSFMCIVCVRLRARGFKSNLHNAEKGGYAIPTLQVENMKL